VHNPEFNKIIMFTAYNSKQYQCTYNLLMNWMQFRDGWQLQVWDLYLGITNRRLVANI